jgi:hypothetical protein
MTSRRRHSSDKPLERSATFRRSTHETRDQLGVVVAIHSRKWYMTTWSRDDCSFPALKRCPGPQTPDGAHYGAWR